MTVPSPMQQRVLDALRSAPSHLDISGLADLLGIGYVTFSEHLDALAKKGHIELERRGPGRMPIVRLPESEPTGFVWPTVWHPMTKPLPESLIHGEVLLIAWWDGLDRRVEVWEASAWSDVRPLDGPSPVELAEFGPYAWCVVKVPAGPDEDLSTIPQSIDTSAGHVEGVDS